MFIYCLIVYGSNAGCQNLNQNIVGIFEYAIEHENDGYYLRAIGLYHEILDSLQYAAEPVFDRGIVLAAIGKCYKQIRDFSQAEKYLKESNYWLSQIPDSITHEYKGEVFISLSEILYEQGFDELSTNYLDSALNVANLLKNQTFTDSMNIAEVYFRMGIYVYYNETPNSIFYLKKARLMLPKSNLKNYYYWDSHLTVNIAINYNKLGDYNSAQEFYHESIRTNTQNADTANLILSLTGLGMCYFNIDSIKQAEEILNRSWQIVNERDSFFCIYAYSSASAIVDAIYIPKKKYIEAIEFLEEYLSKTIKLECPFKTNVFTIHRKLAALYGTVGLNNKAETSFNHAEILLNTDLYAQNDQALNLYFDLTSYYFYKDIKKAILYTEKSLDIVNTYFKDQLDTKFDILCDLYALKSRVNNYSIGINDNDKKFIFDYRATVELSSSGKNSWIRFLTYYINELANDQKYSEIYQLLEKEYALIDSIIYQEKYLPSIDLLMLFQTIIIHYTTSSESQKLVKFIKSPEQLQVVFDANKNPKEMESMYRGFYAKLLIHNLDTTNAVAYYEDYCKNVLLSGSNEPYAFYELGSIYYNQNKFSKAEEYFYNCIEILDKTETQSFTESYSYVSHKLLYDKCISKLLDLYLNNRIINTERTFKLLLQDGPSSMVKVRYLEKKEKLLQALISEKYTSSETTNRSLIQGDINNLMMHHDSLIWKSKKSNLSNNLVFGDAIVKIGLKYDEENIAYQYYAVIQTQSENQVVILGGHQELNDKYYQSLDLVNQHLAYCGQIYKYFWNKIDSCISTRIERIFFIPAGLYDVLNIEMFYDSVQNLFLIEKYDINLLSNLISIEFDVTYFSKKVVLIGDPLFSKNNISTTFQGINSLSKTRNYINGSWIALPKTRDEIKNLKDIFDSSGYDSEILIAENASELNVRRVQSPSFLHIATHGFYNEDRSTHRNGLVFSNANDVSSLDFANKEDGYFFSEDFRNINLSNTKLVTLSACQIGYYDFEHDKSNLWENVFSSGASNIIASMWPVDDQVTAEFMRNFYNHMLAGGNINLSFKKAKRDLMIRNSDPFKWGAFILVNGQYNFRTK